MDIDAPLLVVDDDASSVELITRYLGHLRLVNPIRTYVSSSAAAAYLSAAVGGAAPVPALALLDLHMPDVAGFDLLALIRELGLEGRFPVVLLTGSTEVADLECCLALGATAYLVKPVAYDAFGHVVRNLDVPWALSPA